MKLGVMKIWASVKGFSSGYEYSIEVDDWRNIIDPLLRELENRRITKLKTNNGIGQE